MPPTRPVAPTMPMRGGEEAENLGLISNVSLGHAEARRSAGKYWEGHPAHLRGVVQRFAQIVRAPAHAPRTGVGLQVGFLIMVEDTARTLTSPGAAVQLKQVPVLAGNTLRR